MVAGLGRMDFFNIDQSPSFEPRRQAAIQGYEAGVDVPLLFQPVKASVEGQVRAWLQSYGEVVNAFDRKSLKAWRQERPGHRSFTVLRHPLARAHRAFCEYLDKDWMPELRGHLKRVHKVDLPAKGQDYPDAASHRAGFVKWLEMTKHLHAGRTELRTPPHLATQLATVTGFAQLQAPDHLLREERLAESLAFLCAEVGVEMKPLADVTEKEAYSLAEIYGHDLEAAARDAYGRDYAAFGYGDWR
jgi:hypothetical protein